MKGKFVTFEGCEGAGKTKQLFFLTEYLKKKEVKFLLTREPGGDKIAENIRQIILDNKNVNMTNQCEALLYASARAQMLDTVVKPALEENTLVLSDRFVDSSFAYQGYARGLGLDFIEKINDYALKNFMPDLTIFFNISPAQAFLRKGGADKSDRLEQQGIEFHNKVYEGYLKVAEKYKDRIVLLDCLGTKEETHRKIIKILKEKGIIND